MEEQYLFIDFEFTMPQSKNNPVGFVQEIIEVGIVCVRNNEIYDTFSSYVQSEKFPFITDRCKAFLQISQEDVRSGINFSELTLLLESYEKFQSSTIVTWGNMDMKILKQNCDMHGFRFPFKGKVRDLSLEYKRFFGDRNQTGLWKAVQEYGSEGVGKHHRAFDDAMTTYQIFKKVESDKQYLLKPAPPTIGDRIDFSKILKNISISNN